MPLDQTWLSILFISCFWRQRTKFLVLEVRLSTKKADVSRDHKDEYINVYFDREHGSKVGPDSCWTYHVL